ncbi:arsenate reductase/protein-tyrosine-phosphatase family protein [Roseicyclus marinus]|uniref:arsenate reductase/protein-tyrosine-phosphatase family protein n=1 Tax=Roseicyclus marinus TaxID=2161673 RepID=UPI00240FEF0A|nr:helix-turn-helix domain-containing protein [Roseicyclus marinus]MDG3041351.1 helix-turn-helix domain-containing protein [Roseicyclus marinus]
MEIMLTDRFAALSHPARLDVVQLLIRRYPDKVPAGEIAEVLGLKPNTLSAYLADLMQAGLITRDRIGTSLRYAADMDGLRMMTDGLLRDCCRGRADLCPPLSLSAPDGDRIMPNGRYKVLFICTGNSARSIFAETILREMAGDRFEVFSAGTQPQSALNPMAVEMLRLKGHDTAALRSKNLSEFQGAGAPVFDFVFTVCDRAANEACPPWPGQPMSAHWSTPDPVKAQGTEAERMLAFQSAYGMLRNRILAFTALPLDTLDRISLQRALDGIAKTEGAA